MCQRQYSQTSFYQGKKTLSAIVVVLRFHKLPMNNKQKSPCLNNDWTIPESINNSNESARNLVQWVSHVSQPVNKEQPLTILRRFKSSPRCVSSERPV